MSSEITVLLVDDDAVFRATLKRAFLGRGVACLVAADAIEGRALADAHRISHAVIDLRMPGPSGLELVEYLCQRAPAPRVVLLSGYASIPAAVRAIQVGAVACLAKPADADQILTALDLTDRKDEEVSRDELRAPSLAKVEWEHMHRVLADTGGNISEAARRLKIPRRTLQRKLSRYAPR